jgi:3-carboxy-cis,cis-muconate cycloisomerase
MRTLSASMLSGTSCDRHFSPRAFVSAILAFEAALARAEASLGLIPEDAAAAIRAAARDLVPDLDSITAKGTDAGTPVVELLAQLAARIETGVRGASAYLHLGATSQDALDTATVLCVKPCVSLALTALEEARRQALRLASEHAASPMLARTLMQAAGITTFGLKAATWGASLTRCERRVREAAGEGLSVQLGGAVGSGLMFGDRWEALRAAVACELDLATGPSGTWQAMRDGWANLLVQIGLATGVAAKIAGDLALMAQTEVGEIHEPASAKASARRGTSSALPHKQNPVLCMRILGCGHAVQGLTASLLPTLAVEHERGLGTWQAELAIAPDLISYAVGALEALAELLKGLRFDGLRAQRNIDATCGLVFADQAMFQLARVLPRDVVSQAVGTACNRVRAEGGHLRDAIRHALEPHRAQGSQPELTVDAALAAAFDPAASIEAASRGTERILQAEVRDQGSGIGE